MDQKTKEAAENRFQKLKGGNAGGASWTPLESELRSAEANTARLKEARLARDAETGTAVARRKPAKKQAARKGVGSY